MDHESAARWITLWAPLKLEVRLPTPAACEPSQLLLPSDDAAPVPDHVRMVNEQGLDGLDQELLVGDDVGGEVDLLLALHPRTTSGPSPNL